MGVYNTIQTDLACPVCHAQVEWQSKRLVYDGYLLANVMEMIHLSPHMDGEMHTSCSSCHMRLDAEIVEGQVVAVKQRELPRVFGGP